MQKVLLIKFSILNLYENSLGLGARLCYCFP